MKLRTVYPSNSSRLNTQAQQLDRRRAGCSVWGTRVLSKGSPVAWLSSVTRWDRGVQRCQLLWLLHRSLQPWFLREFCTVLNVGNWSELKSSVVEVNEKAALERWGLLASDPWLHSLFPAGGLGVPKLLRFRKCQAVWFTYTVHFLF